MCDCLKNLQDELLKQFKEENPDAEVKETYFDNSAFIDRDIKDGKMQMPLELCSSLKIDYFIKSSKGKDIHKRKKYNLCFTYCPFCGKKLGDKE